MTIRSGYFNSTETPPDRLYNADDMNRLLGGLITDGIFSSIGDTFNVTSNTGMLINIGIGRAWFLDTWLDVDSVENLTVSTAIAGYDRIDLVVLEFNKTTAIRSNTINIVSGTGAATPLWPSLIDTNENKQIPIAAITVRSGTTEILQSDIQNLVGTSHAPLVTSILTQMSFDQIINQWNNQFDEWFNNLQNNLDNNQVTNLQNQIDYLNNIINLKEGRNKIINGGFNVWQRGEHSSQTVSTTNGYVKGMPDRWIFNKTNSGTWNTFKTSMSYNGVTQRGLKLTCLTTGTYDNTTSVSIKQKLEGVVVSSFSMGSFEAEDLVISFVTRTNTPGDYIVEFHSPAGDKVSLIYTCGDDVIERHELVVPKRLVNPSPVDNTEGLMIEFHFDHGLNTTGPYLNNYWTNSPSTDTRVYGQTQLGMSVGNYFELASVQLEIGTNASVFEFETYDKTLEKCCRYYEVLEGYSIANRFNLTGDDDEVICYLPVKDYKSVKRIIPTLDEFDASVGVPTSYSFLTVDDWDFSLNSSWSESSEKGVGSFYLILNPNGNTVSTSHQNLMMNYIFEADAEL